MIQKLCQVGVKTHPSAKLAGLEPIQSPLVIDGARLGVFENFVSVLCLLEFFMGFFSSRFRDFVRVVGEGELGL